MVIMSFESPQNKIEKKDSFAHELFKLDENQLVDLRERIEKNKGLIRVFIHQDSISQAKYPKQALGIQKTTMSEVSPPIIFLEDCNYLDGFRKNIDSIQENLPNSVYFVETYPSFPYPIFPGSPSSHEPKSFNEMSEAEQDGTIKGMRFLGHIFNILGVKKILVGGANLDTDTPERLQECVGNFIELFNTYAEKFDFDIKVSSLTIPKNRQDLIGVRDEFVDGKI